MDSRKRSSADDRRHDHDEPNKKRRENNSRSSPPKDRRSEQEKDCRDGRKQDRRDDQRDHRRDERRDERRDDRVEDRREDRREDQHARHLGKAHGDGSSRRRNDNRKVPNGNRKSAPAPAPAPAVLPPQPTSRPLIGHQEALSKLPPATATALTDIPAYRPFQVADDLPELPSLNEVYQDAPFRHKSRHGFTHDTPFPAMTYEQLEFLGDAYIELIASRLIFDRFAHLQAGEQSQLRELLVKNETLAEYSRAYRFDEKEEMKELSRVVEASKKGNKGFNKILGDVFEAYVAAVVLSDVENGFSVAEKWLVTLWAPKLVQAAQDDPHRVGRHFKIERDGPLYDPAALATLRRRLDPFGRLRIETSRPTVELKGDKLGQNINYVNLYLTCFEHQDVLLAEGEGRNKKEAGNFAAMKAMTGEKKGLLDELEKRVTAEKAAKRQMDALSKQNAGVSNKA